MEHNDVNQVGGDDAVIQGEYVFLHRGFWDEDWHRVQEYFGTLLNQVEGENEIFWRGQKEEFDRIY